MAIVTLTNSTSPNTVERATDDQDPFERETHLDSLAHNFDDHDHTAGKNLGVGRVQTASAPAAAGGVRVNGDAWQWWGATAGAVRTAVDLEGAQTIAGQKVFSANVGLGVTPSAWHADFRALQAGQAGALWAGAGTTATYLSSNVYYDGARKAIATAAASEIEQSAGAITFKTAPSVAAGAAQTFTERLTITQAGAITLNAAASAFAFNIGGANKLTVDASANAYPGADNAGSCGTGGNRWTAVYAVNGTIQTSARDMKEGIVALAPEAALAAVRATPLYTFTYKGSDRPHVGFLADEVPDIVSPDHASASPQTTASLALAAIQALDARLTALEAR